MVEGGSCLAGLANFHLGQKTKKTNEIIIIIIFKLHHVLSRALLPHAALLNE